MPGSALASGDLGNYKESDEVKGQVSAYNAGVASNAGWRYGFVALKDDGGRVYGTMNINASGTASFDVPADTKSLYFVVTGAPTKYTAHPWDEKELNDEQYPYKVKFENTDLLGSVVIDPDSEPENLTLTYNLAFPADAANYSGSKVNLNTNGDVSKLSKALVLQPSAILGALLPRASQPQEGRIAFAAVQSDGSLSYNFTANGYGFWYDSSGDVIVWGNANDSKVFVEYAETAFEFSAGQYPGKCIAGDKFTVKMAMIYTKNSVQYRAIFTFNITIT
jgi:hypothetical protein